MVILNPWVSNIKGLESISFGNEFLFKSILSCCVLEWYICFKLHDFMSHKTEEEDVVSIVYNRQLEEIDISPPYSFSFMAVESLWVKEILLP